MAAAYVSTRRALVAAVLTLGGWVPASAQATGDSTLIGFAALVGSWSPSRSPGRTQQPVPPPDFVLHQYAWTVNGMALRVRENFRAAHPEAEELDGMVYWNPATERVEFLAVGGGGPGQGRLFQGEYRVLADGAVERVYDVFYRTLADTPGEEFGGSRRRYREIYRWVTADSVKVSLDWWHERQWRPFGPGAYAMVRRG
jgi:hypothetical protein